MDEHLTASRCAAIALRTSKPTTRSLKIATALRSPTSELVLAASRSGRDSRMSARYWRRACTRRCSGHLARSRSGAAPLGRGGARRRARFEREIELVSSLRHPGIVTVFDTGRAPDGRDYLVMEWIEGQPIDAFVRAEVRSAAGGRAGCTGRGRRRRRAPAGLSATSSPATSSSTRRARRSSTSAGARRNQHGRTRREFLGTLAFASPEQVSGDATAIDTRSDVYSLGVLLYLLLSQRFPYAVDGPIAQVCSNIRNASPRQISLHGVRRADDLLAILSCALAKEVSRRYQSAADFAADLQRWLKDEPIMARSDSGWYLLRRAVRRHRVWVGAGAIVAAALLVTTGVSLAFWRQSVRDRDEALRAAQARETVVEFLSTMLGAASPTSPGARSAWLTCSTTRRRRSTPTSPISPRSDASCDPCWATPSFRSGSPTRPEPISTIALSRSLHGDDHRDTILNTALLGRLQSERTSTTPPPRRSAARSRGRSASWASTPPTP